MAGEWVARTIGSLGRVVTGKTPPTSDPDNFDGPYPFITIPDLEGRVVIEGSQRTVSQKGAERLKSCLLPAGAVLMSCIATVGKCGITAGPSFTNQQINSLIPNESVDARFLYYIFTQLGHELQAAGGGGSVYTNVSKSRFADIVVLLPGTIQEQRAIAHILGTLDDKIELNRRMSETLGEMARALFKSWFVDFDPVRAKMEGRDTGLPEHLAELFPDRLVESELAEIPEGWEVGAFGRVVEHLRDNESPLDSPGALFRHFSIPAYDSGQWPALDLGESIKSQKSRVPPGTVLLSKLNPEIDRVWLVDVAPDDRSVCSTEFLVLRPRLPFGRAYAYCLARSPELRRQLEGLVTGTSKSHQRAQTASVLALPALMPLTSLLSEFQRIVEPLLGRTLESRRETHALGALRDALLPKLISGELRVKDADKFVERAIA